MCPACCTYGTRTWNPTSSGSTVSSRHPGCSSFQNPKKIKGDYDKALNYIIEQNKRQWAAGFRPNSTDDIVAKAYQKWLLEEN